MAAPTQASSLKSHAHSITLRAIRHLLAGINCLRKVEHPTEADIEIIALVINQAEIARLLLELRGGHDHD